MKTQPWILTIVAITWLAGVASGAAPQGSANWAQADRLVVWDCFPTGEPFKDVPDLALSLTTGGGPVLMMITLQWGVAYPDVVVRMEPVIDGQQYQVDRLTWLPIRDRDVTAFQRVYALSPGPHAFGVRVNCDHDLGMIRGWITVYELPLVKK